MAPSFVYVSIEAGILEADKKGLTLNAFDGSNMWMWSFALLP